MKYELTLVLTTDDTDPETVAVTLEDAAESFRNNPLDVSCVRHTDVSLTDGGTATVVMSAREIA